MPNFEVLNSVVCDEIRKEITGKDIIIGAYGTAIVVPQFPWLMAIGLWFHVLPKKPGQLVLEIMLAVPGQMPITGRLSAQINAPNDPFAMSAPSVPVQIMEEGEIHFLFRELGEEEWTLVHRKPVRLSKAAAT